MIEIIARIKTSSTAPAITSTFGQSLGHNCVERIAFDGFDSPDHHVATLRKIGLLNRLSGRYIPIQALEGDKPTTVYVNKRSFEKRFSHTLAELDLLAKHLPGVKSETAYKRQREHLLQTTEGRVKTVWEAIHTMKKQGLLSARKVEKLLQFADAQPRLAIPAIYYKKPNELARPLLLSPEGNFILLTSASHQGDPLLGQGHIKKAKMAFSELGTKYVVTISRKEACETPEDWERLRDEIRLMYQLKGQAGIVHIVTALESEDKCYIVMEYCDRGDLYSFLFGNTKDLTWPEMFQIARDCAEGMKNMHALGLLNRDLKPENIFLYTDPVTGCLRAKIGDLEFACRAGDPNKISALCGTPSWITPEKARLRCYGMSPSPEAVAAATTEKGDVWTLGAIFYCLFTTRVLECQKGSYGQTIRKKSSLWQEGLSQEIKHSEQYIGSDLVQLLDGMLRVDPAERPTMAQVQEILSQIK